MAMTKDVNEQTREILAAIDELADIDPQADCTEHLEALRRLSEESDDLETLRSLSQGS